MTTVGTEVEGVVEEVATLVAGTGTGGVEEDMVVVVGMIPEEVEETIGAAADTAVVVVVMVEAEMTGVVEEALEVEEIKEEEVAAMGEAETTGAVVAGLVEEGIEEVADLGEGEDTEEVEGLGVASEGMMVVVVVVGTKKFHRRTRSSCRSKYGIDMVIQSYFALFINYSSIEKLIIK